MHEECLRRCVWTTVRVPRNPGRSARRTINDHLVNKYRSDRRRCQVTGCGWGVFVCESRKHRQAQAGMGHYRIAAEKYRSASDAFRRAKVSGADLYSAGAAWVGGSLPGRSGRRRAGSAIVGSIRGGFVADDAVDRPNNPLIGTATRHGGGSERLFRVGGIAPGPGVCDNCGNNTEQMVSKWISSGQRSDDGRTDEEVGSR